MTASARVLVRGGVVEETGEALTAAAVAARVGWSAELVRGMACQLLGEHWNAPDVTALAAGRDAAGKLLPPQAWMAARRLGWASRAPDGVTVNDLPRAARRDQGASTISTGPAAKRPHRARGAALGAGFHLHAHATPPRWESVRKPQG